MKELEVTLNAGITGIATAINGEVLSLISPKAFAPGQPLAFTLPAEHGSTEIQGKSLGSKRRGDDRFDVRLRLINMHRSTRERLVALLRDLT